MRVNENLRRYELDRLKYYFAVVTCDSVGSAERLYAECDGAEFESSSLALDLRFIPDDMDFPKTPRDTASVLPPKYSAPSFMCSALQQSKPTLSWDKDDSERTATMRRDLSKSEVKEMEYAAYLASGSDSDDEGVEEYAFAGPRPPKGGSSTAEGLRALLKGDQGGGSDEGDDQVDREMTFEAAAAEGVRKRGKKGGGADGELAPTVFEQEEEKRRRKKRERRAQRLGLKEGDGSVEQPEADGEGDGGDGGGGGFEELPPELANDPFFAEALAQRDAEEEAARGGTGAGGKKLVDRRRGAVAGDSAAATLPGKPGKPNRKKGKKGKRGGTELTAEEAAEEARKAAELELMMVGDDEDEAREARRGYDLKTLELPKEKGGKRKRAEAAAAAKAAADEDTFQLDVADSRFNSIYRKSDFAIDPTHPKFRRTLGSESLLAETQRRHASKGESGHGTHDGNSDDDDAARGTSSRGGASSSTGTGAGAGGGKDDRDLWRLVSMVKAKTKSKAKRGVARGVAAGKARAGY